MRRAADGEGRFSSRRRREVGAGVDLSCTWWKCEEGGVRRQWRLVVSYKYALSKVHGLGFGTDNLIWARRLRHSRIRSINQRYRSPSRCLFNKKNVE